MVKANIPEDIVQINELELDKECIKFPSLYLQASNASADAKRDLAELESELKVMEAELSYRIRKDPAKYGMEKVTENAINETITISNKHKEKVREVMNARRDAELAQALVWAMEAKKRSLTLLVDLHGLGYFAKVKVSKEGRDAVESMTARKVRRGRPQLED